MKTISVNFPPKIAQAFEQADAAVKQKAELYINACLQDFFSRKSLDAKLRAIMKKSNQRSKSQRFYPG